MVGNRIGSGRERVRVGAVNLSVGFWPWGEMGDPNGSVSLDSMCTFVARLVFST